MNVIKLFVAATATACAILLAEAHQPATAPQPRPPIVGLAHVAIQTSDLSKARRFYGDLLGYREIGLAGGAHVAVFSVNARQRLILRDGLPADRDERLLNVAFETTSLTTLHSYFRARGVRATDPVRDAEAGGHRLEVTDSDGHPIQFVELGGGISRENTAGPALSGAERPAMSSVEGADRRVARRILHAGLTIRDAAAADRFYKEMLGFSEIWRGGRTADVTSWINMRVPDATDYLEYMLVAGPVDRRQLGVLHHAALLVPDIQEALELVRSRVAPEDPNRRATPQIGRNNRWQLNLFDPDGTRIELMEPWTVR